MIRREKLLWDKNILNDMFEGILGVQNMHPIEIACVSKKSFKANMQKLNRIKREREHPQTIFSIKYANKRKYKNWNTSVLPPIE